MTRFLETGTLFPLSVCQNVLDDAGIGYEEIAVQKCKSFDTLFKKKFDLLPAALKLPAVLVCFFILFYFILSFVGAKIATVLAPPLASGAVFKKNAARENIPERSRAIVL